MTEASSSDGRMRFAFGGLVVADPDGGYLVTFPDVPEAITHGDDRPMALSNASEALGVALRGYAADAKPLPRPVVAGDENVPVGLADAMKLAVIEAFRIAGLSKTELARRLGKTETEARRILDPKHPTKLPMIERALAAMGKKAVVDLIDA